MTTGSRIVSALILVPIVAAVIFYAPSWLQAAAVVLVSVVSVFELAMMLIPPLQLLGQPVADIKLARRGAAVGAPLCVSLLTAGFLVCFFYFHHPVTIIAMVVLLACIGAAWCGGIAYKLGSIVGMLVSFCYACLPWVCVWYLMRSGNIHELVYLFTVVWLSEAAAYFGGLKYGKRPLAKLISPSKTLEGLAFALLAGVVVAVLLAPLLRWGIPIYIYPGVGIATVLIATGGDLLMSVCKRFSGVSDSGSLIHGHGGILDCADGVLAVAPFLLLWTMWLD
ncbi:MAG: phosphatidate cytidylyltransferase [Pseudomonadota bacterium]|nr:phosphatidate cytidylyltransferase [Pseudomonadota bacterium]